MIFWERIFNILDIYHFNRIINFLKPLEIEKVIDVGAHKGEFLSYILKLKKIKKIFVFEPQIAINKILSKKFKLIKKIKIFNYALDNKISKKYIYINKFTNTSTLSKFNKDSYYLKFKNLLTRSKNNYIDKYIVKTNTINNLFRNTELKKSLLKIDVEGFEINVLKGAKKIISKFNYILIENRPVDLYKNKSSLTSHGFLVENNFKVYKNFCHPLLIFSDCLYKRAD